MKIISLDIETTGLSPDRDRIIEIGAALVNMKTRKIEKTYETFVQPGVPIPHLVINLTGITDKDVEKAPNLKDIKDDLIKFIGDYPIMGHNISFDIDFLEAAGIPLSNPRLDSMDIAHIAIPKAKSYSLEIVAGKLGIPEHGKHRALKDVENNVEVMFALLDLYFSANNPREIIEKSQSPWKEIMLEHKPRKAGIPNLESRISTSEIPNSTFHIPHSTLLQLPPHSTQALIPQEPELKTIIATEGPEEIFTLLDANQYLNHELFQKLTEKPTLTPEETVFILKILPLLEDSLFPKTAITLPQNIKNLWFDYAHTVYPPEILEKQGQVTILSHFTLPKFASRRPSFFENTHLIIDDIDELYINASKSLTVTYFEKRFLSLPKAATDRLTILFGLIGMMYEKFGEKFDLELEEHHFSSMEWSKISDTIENISQALEDEEHTEEKLILDFLNKAKTYSKNTSLKLNITQNGSPILKITPLNIDEFFESKVWPLPEKLTFASSAITFEGEKPPGKFLKKLLKLPKGTKVDIRNSKSDIRNSKFETIDLPDPKSHEFQEKADQYLLKNLPKLAKPAFILVGSQRLALRLHQKLALPLKDEGITVLTQGASGGMGKIKSISQQKPENTVLIGTYAFWKFLNIRIWNIGSRHSKSDIRHSKSDIQHSKFDIRHSTFETLIIYKAPFPPPSHLSFKDYALPSTMLKLKKTALSASKVISLDSRITHF